MVARIDPAQHERRSSPTDLDRERVRAHVDQVIRCLRDGLSRCVLDVHLSGLHGASIQRLYVKLVVRGLTRWLAETLTRDDLVAYAHHVASQDGAPTAGTTSASRLLTLSDNAAAILLRAMAKLVEQR
jgi:KaiC/GvpD/RAD55 family RecA-like ATPase